MNIEHFVKESLGAWKSMRSGHSLAFQQFEEVISKIQIQEISKDSSEVCDLIESKGYINEEALCPFKIDWSSESDWNEKSDKDISSGSSLFIPIPSTSKRGVIIRSLGYCEKQPAISNYNFLEDSTLILSTKYNSTLAEERIWFLSNYVRCRSSVLRSSESSAILQTSYASEIKQIKA